MSDRNLFIHGVLRLPDQREHACPDFRGLRVKNGAEPFHLLLDLFGRVQHLMAYVDQAVVCIHCGCAVDPPNTAVAHRDDTLETVVKIFLILGCISLGWLIFPLLWRIPITVTLFKKMKYREPIGTGLKVCTLLFVDLIAGICLLCMDD